MAQPKVIPPLTTETLHPPTIRFPSVVCLNIWRPSSIGLYWDLFVCYGGGRLLMSGGADELESSQNEISRDFAHERFGCTPSKVRVPLIEPRVMHQSDEYPLGVWGLGCYPPKVGRHYQTLTHTQNSRLQPDKGLNVEVLVMTTITEPCTLNTLNPKP